MFIISTILSNTMSIIPA